MNALKKTRVCLFDFEPMVDFHGYEIHTFSPFDYIGTGRRGGVRRLIQQGLEAYSVRKWLYKAELVDKLYRRRDPAYMRMVADFIERFRSFELIILANYNPIHPEILHNELPNTTKILGFIDDPSSTYVRGLPYLWAFDGAFYISPSYDERSLFDEKLGQWGCQERTWWPLRPFKDEIIDPCDAYFEDRDIDLVYIGKAYGSKIDRIVELKRHFGARFHVYGYWPFGGYFGVMRGMLGKPILWQRVSPLSSDERRNVYRRAKIGINMHLSNCPRETGNMRMYEVPAHGALLLCDKAGRDAHESIFSPGDEAIYYDSTPDAIEKAEYFLSHDPERLQVARSGFQRASTEYDWEVNLRRLLDWSMGVRARSLAGAENPVRGGDYVS